MYGVTSKCHTRAKQPPLMSRCHAGCLLDTHTHFRTSSWNLQPRQALQGNRTGRSRTFSRRCYLCSHHRHTHHPAIERLFPYSGQNTKTTTAVQSQSKVLTSPWSTSLSICINTSTPTASHVGACDASSLRSSSRFVRIDAHLILRFSGQCVGG
jgi:hypothetical protein